MLSLSVEIPAPQANSLPALSVVVDAVADDCVTDEAIAEAIGYSGRQGAYYPNAAAELGLIVEVVGPSPREWQLTREGATFVGLDAADRAAYLVSLLCESKWLCAYVESPHEARELIEEMGYSDDTADRRLACIASWAEFVFEADPPAQAHRIAMSMSGTRQRIPGARASQRRGHQPRTVRRCTSCYLEIPAALNECEACG